MTVKDQDIFRIVGTISEHYDQNINNRFLRNILLHLQLDRRTWESIDSLVSQSEYTRLQGYRYDELYINIHAMAVFIAQVRKDILPNLRSLMSSAGFVPDRDKIIRDMVVNNLGPNLGILADKVNELFIRTIELDKLDHPNGRAEYEKIPEVAEIGRLLVSK